MIAMAPILIKFHSSSIKGFVHVNFINNKSEALALVKHTISKCHYFGLENPKILTSQKKFFNEVFWKYFILKKDSNSNEKNVQIILDSKRGSL